MFKKILFLINLILFTSFCYANQIASWATLSDSMMPSRESTSMISYNGSVYVLNGQGLSMYNDCWRSASGIYWTEQTNNASYEPRFGSVVTKFNFQFFLIGGSSTTSPFSFHDVWSSTDNGTTWQAVTRNAGFPDASVGTSDSTNLYVIPKLSKSVYSSTNGVLWNLITNTAEFNQEDHGALISYNNNLYYFGGVNSGVHSNQIFKSSNGGLNWSFVGNANWSGRSNFAYTIDTNINRIWIIGGETNSGLTAEAWYTDNIDNNTSWIQDTDYPVTNYNLQAIIHNGRLMVLDGSDYTNYGNTLRTAQFSGATATPTNTYALTNTFTNTPTDTFTPALTNTFTSTSTPFYTPTIMATHTPYPTPVFIKWTKLTSNATWSARNVASSITWLNNIYTGYGRTDCDATPVSYGLYSSSDGINWNTATNTSLPAVNSNGRYNASFLQWNNKVYIIGGDLATYSPCGPHPCPSAFVPVSIWHTENFVDYTQDTGNAFGLDNPGDGGAIVNYNGTIYAVGGQMKNGETTQTTSNHVWSSTDMINWNLIASNPAFLPRSIKQVLNFKNKMWIIGGLAYDINLPGVVYEKDVWNSTNGIDWNEVTGNAEFTGADSFYLWNDEDYMYRYEDTQQKVWMSADGIVWTQINNWDVPPDTRRLSSSTLLNNNLYVLGGYNNGTPCVNENDVWIGSLLNGTPTNTPTNTPTRTQTPTQTPINIIVNNLTPFPTMATTLYINIINWPTAIPTITNTLTNSPTPTGSATPIFTPSQPILRFTSESCDQSRTRMFIEWTKFNDPIVTYTLTVYDTQRGNTATYILHDSDSLNPAENGWVSFALDYLIYGTCYNVNLSINKVGWSTPITATQIALCPYQTPTPFAGTATYTPTPNCVATASPVVTVVVTTGVIAYEDFTGQTDNLTATSSNVSIDSPSGKYWYVKTIGGLKSMYPQDTTFTYSDSGASKTYDASGSAVIQFKAYTSATSGWWLKPFFTGTSATLVTASLSNQYYGAGGFSSLNNICTSQVQLPWAWSAQWYTIQSVFKTQNHHWFISDANGNTLTHFSSNKDTYAVPTGSGKKGVYTNPAVVADYLTAFTFLKDTVITFTGLPTGYSVQIVDGSTTAKKYSATASAGTATIDLLGCIFPYSGKIMISATNGIVVYTDSITRNIYGGDNYAVTVTP